MSLSNLEKQQQRIAQLNKTIKHEKEKIDQKLGHEIIKSLHIDYTALDKKMMNQLVSQIVLKLQADKGFQETNESSHD